MSELLEVIKTRRSIRKYKPDMIPKEIIDKIVEAGTYAATGMDSSHQSFWQSQTRKSEIKCPNGMPTSLEKTLIHSTEHQ